MTTLQSEYENEFEPQEENEEEEEKGGRPKRRKKPKKPTKRVLRPPEASDYVGLSRSTLAKRRLYGQPPRYVSLGRAVGYLIEDLDQYLESCRRSSTSESPVLVRDNTSETEVA